MLRGFGRVKKTGFGSMTAGIAGSLPGRGRGLFSEGSGWCGEGSIFGQTNRVRWGGWGKRHAQSRGLLFNPLLSNCFIRRRDGVGTHLRSQLIGRGPRTISRLPVGVAGRGVVSCGPTDRGQLNNQNAFTRRRMRTLSMCSYESEQVILGCNFVSVLGLSALHVPCGYKCIFVEQLSKRVEKKSWSKPVVTRRGPFFKSCDSQKKCYRWADIWVSACLSYHYHYHCYYFIFFFYPYE